MAKKTKDELMAYVNESAVDDDIKIALLEDISDSWEETEKIDVSEFESRIAELEGQLGDLRERYKARFFEGSEDAKDDSEKIIDEDVKDVIDVKEI